MNSSIKNHHQKTLDQATENIKRNLAYYGRLLQIKKFKNPAFVFIERD